MPLASPLPEDRISADDAEKRMIERRGQFLMDGYGFGMIQGTRPQRQGHLTQRIRNALRSLQKIPALVRSMFQHPSVRYAA
jgi:hypothetical protein